MHIQACSIAKAANSKLFTWLRCSHSHETPRRAEFKNQAAVLTRICGIVNNPIPRLSKYEAVRDKTKSAFQIGKPRGKRPRKRNGRRSITWTNTLLSWSKTGGARHQGSLGKHWAPKLGRLSWELSGNESKLDCQIQSDDFGRDHLNDALVEAGFDVSSRFG